MREPHYHEWKYDETRKVLVNNSRYEYWVTRFCLQCHQVEEIKLLDNAKQIYERNKIQSNVKWNEILISTI